MNLKKIMKIYGRVKSVIKENIEKERERNRDLFHPPNAL
jgi:hypothetical protein